MLIALLLVLVSIVKQHEFYTKYIRFCHEAQFRCVFVDLFLYDLIISPI